MDTAGNGLSRLGVDFGGVVARKAGAGAGRLRSGGFIGVDPAPMAFASLRDLSEVFGGRVWVISKAGHGTERWTREWLHSCGFHSATGIPVERLCFVRETADKRFECERIGITHYVDDQLEVLQQLRGVVEHLYLFGCGQPPDSAHKSSAALELVDPALSAGGPPFTRVRDWQELLSILRADFRR